MLLGSFVTGGTLGFAIAAPVGPIGALVIRRTLAEGPISGVVTGLGAASADAVYGALAAFGLTAITAALVDQQRWLSVAGGVFLCYLGVRILRSPPAEPGTTPAPVSLAAAYASTLLLTLANPATILSFVAVFAGLGLGRASASYAAAGSFVAGVFIGSALWWLLLSTGVGLLRGRIQRTGLKWVNRLSGSFIVAAGVLAGLSAAA